MRGPRILIIEDFPEDAELLIDLAMQSDMEVVGSAASVTEAVTVLENIVPDCILLDYRLAGEDGLRLLERITRAQPFMPVVMLSGQGSEKVATQALKAGAVSYLPKRGLDAGALQSAVSQAIRLKRHQGYHVAQSKGL